MPASSTSSSPITTTRPRRQPHRVPRALPPLRSRSWGRARPTCGGASLLARHVPQGSMGPENEFGLREVLTGTGRRAQAPIVRQHPETGRPAYHEMIARVAVLERAAVFFSLPEGVLRALARRLRRVTVASGEMIVCQGEPGDTIFFIEQGRCRVVIERPPSVVTVAVLTDGDFFGEDPWLLKRPQQASVYAQTDCVLLAVDRQSLQLVLGRDRTAIENLTRVADHRFRTFADTTVQATWGTLFKEATVVGVYSPKGGSGGTCLSLNVVGSLA